MSTRLASYRQTLRNLDGDWFPFLLRESRLPGPRANLELAQAAALEGGPAFFARCLADGPQTEPSKSPEEFLVMCGLLGLGRLLAEGDLSGLPTLRHFAQDARWRAREAVAMALQAWGAADLPALLDEMEAWAQGGPLEQRAAAAALCEPALLGDPQVAARVLGLLDRITADLAHGPDRKSEGWLALRKGLAYCWSVAAAANPPVGKRAMEKWFASPDRDVRWVMKQNLAKQRLVRMDPAWVQRWQAALAGDRPPKEAA